MTKFDTMIQGAGQCPAPTNGKPVGAAHLGGPEYFVQKAGEAA